MFKFNGGKEINQKVLILYAVFLLLSGCTNPKNKETKEPPIVKPDMRIQTLTDLK